MMIEFASPLAFVLLPMPALVYFLWPRAEVKNPALRVPFYAQMQLAAQSGQTSGKIGRGIKRLVILITIWVLLILSAANPQRIGTPIALPMEGRDLLLAMDISGSMSTADMLVQNEHIARILVVKYILGEFLEQRAGDRVGLILFGTNAYLQAPLTFDLKTIRQFLNETTLRLAGERTAIGDAIGLAVKRLKDRPESQRVVILLTDGENTAGTIEPRKAADLAAQANVKIYTVGVGAETMQVSRGIFGGSQNINPSADLDEDTLRYIADTTGGAYFRARDPAELQAIYQKLNEIEAIEQNDAFYRPIQSLYIYPMSFALILCIISYFTLALVKQNKI